METPRQPHGRGRGQGTQTHGHGDAKLVVEGGGPLRAHAGEIRLPAAPDSGPVLPYGAPVLLAEPAGLNSRWWRRWVVSRSVLMQVFDWFLFCRYLGVPEGRDEGNTTEMSFGVLGVPFSGCGVWGW